VGYGGQAPRPYKMFHVEHFGWFEGEAGSQTWAGRTFRTVKALFNNDPHLLHHFETVCRLVFNASRGLD
jgi:hypothetical protein